MMIMIRKCEVCLQDRRSDDPAYQLFSVLQHHDGLSQDVCHYCVNSMVKSNRPK